MTLHLLLRIQVEDLHRGSLSEGNDALDGVHKGGFGGDASLGDLGTVSEVDHDDLRWFHADDPVFGFHGGESMFDGCLGDS